MRATRFNKSEIMKQAWSMYRNTFFHYTFSQALRMAWHYAKEEVARQEAVEARKAQQAAEQAVREAAKVETKKDRFYKSFNKTINREYKNVTMGRNDWRVSYGRRYY